MKTIKVQIAAEIDDAGRLSIEHCAVVGELDLSDPEIHDIPFSLTVRGDLILRGSQVTYLPPDLHVYGDLDLSETDVGEIAEGLKVGGDLTLGPAVEELPERMAVFGDLYLGRSKVKKVEITKERIVVGRVRLKTRYDPEDEA